LGKTGRKIRLIAQRIGVHRLQALSESLSQTSRKGKSN